MEVAFPMAFIAFSTYHPKDPHFKAVCNFKAIFLQEENRSVVAVSFVSTSVDPL